MEHQSILDFLKELSVGFKSAKSYPPGHPVMEKVVANTVYQLAKLYQDYPEFSFYFLEKTVIFQDIRIDVSRNLAVLSFIEGLMKNEIESLSFTSGATDSDVKNLYEVMSSSKLKIKEYGDPSSMLRSKGTERIKINAVKFGIQAGATIQVAEEKKKDAPSPELTDIEDAIKNLKEYIEKAANILNIKGEFEKIIKSGDIIPEQMQQTQSEAVAKILEALPYEHRIELLRDIEIKPFVLKILSGLSEEKLLELIVARSEDTKGIKQILGTLSEDKIQKLLPMLKDKIPNIYEYLAQIGFLLSERLTSLFSKEDLYSTIRPYYTMLDSQNARVREEGIKSLAMLAGRFIRQGYLDIAEETTFRISLSLEQEAVSEVISNSLEQIYNLYNVARSFNHSKICNAIVEPFNKILGQQGLSLQFKKLIINFLGETNNPITLSTLLSFLWEAGLYPEVRAAIIKFGKDAVGELLLTLKEAEDYSLGMKIVDILKNIGKDSLEILLKNIDAPEWYLRRNILNIIGEIGTEEICPQLEPLINDPDDRVRLELVRTFTRLNHHQGLKLLLKDGAIEVRAEALRSLRKIISDQEIIGMLPALKEKGDAFNAELLKIIGERKIKEALPYIIDSLTNLEFRDDQTAQALKELGISTLVKLPIPELRNVLTEFSNAHDKYLSHLAQSALKRIS